MGAPAVELLAKAIGPVCNLDCRYCYYLEKEALHPQGAELAMPDEVLERFIRDAIALSSGPRVTFAWQGGEPTLLGLDYFRRIVELEERHAGGRRVDNAVQTNGVLVDDAWAEFFREHGFLVGVSIDGPRELHDAYRRDRGGRGSFDRVTRGLETLQRHGVELNTLTTVHRANADHPLEVYRFLKQVGSGFLQFIPVVERAAAKPAADGLALVTPEFSGAAALTPWSVEPRAYGRFLSAIFDEWVRRDVGSVFVQLFDVALEAWCGLEPSLCVFKERCGGGPVVERSGDVYACDHYVYPDHRLGNLMETPLEQLVGSERQQRFGAAKSELPARCRSCDVGFACNGGCPKHRFAGAADERLGYLCAGYQDFFRHIDPAMRFMADELAAGRPPSNVMRAMAHADAASALAGARRNDPCPCGSGRKFKHCCGAH